MADVGSGPKTHDVPLLVRIGSIEERFEHFERKTDRIESMLNELIRNQSSASQSSDDRVDKIVNNALTPIRETQTEHKANIKALDSGKRFNLIGTAVVVGTVFTVFAWFNSQAQQSTRDLIASENNVVRLQVAGEISPIRSDVTVMKNSIDTVNNDLRDYRSFKDVVVQQNSTSIQDRKDQSDSIKLNAEKIAGLDTELKSFAAETRQRATEVETQFRLEGQIRNVQFSDQQRKNSELQNTLHDLGGKIPVYPSAPFYQPNVSQQQSGGSQ